MSNPLIDLYPFLQLKDNFTGEIIDTNDTWLDQMPEGWRIAFGLQMVEEISNILKKAHFINDYKILQIKEKWGSLRWYDSGTPTSIYRELQECISKYEKISYKTCIVCGAQADGQTTGWIVPLCQKCSDKERLKIVPFEG